MSTTMKQLPDMARSFDKIKLIVDLRAALNENIFLGCTIAWSIDSGDPADQIISMIKDQIKDNREAVERAIDWKMVKRIDEW